MGYGRDGGGNDLLLALKGQIDKLKASMQGFLTQDSLDSSLSETSENPVQNKAIAAAITAAITSAINGVVEVGGTTANGWAKFANGLLVCFGNYAGSAQATTAVGSLYLLEVRPSITFGHAFTANPDVAVTPQANYGIVMNVGRTTTGITSVELARPSNANLTPRFMWIAVGFWK